MATVLIFRSGCQVGRLCSRLKASVSLINGRSMSSAVVQEENAPRSPKTSENDPRKHTVDHLGLYYSVTEEDKKTIFHNSIHQWHNKLMSTFGESCFMVRKPSLELEGYIKNINLNHPVHRFVLFGRRGAGKRCVMLHTMHSLHKDNWIIVHLPWAGTWVRGWKKEITESSHKPGLFDLPNDGAAWLTHFRSQNGSKLANLKTTAEYIWTQREKAEVGTPLDEIINFGLSRLKFSSDCVGVILKELRKYANEQQIKVLVAVHSVNAFYKQWNCINTLKSPQHRPVKPDEVSLVYNFKKMLSPTWRNGVVICTVDLSAAMVNERAQDTPCFLLGQEGFEALDPFVPIHVPEYSEKECLSNIDYFIANNWIQNEYGKTEMGKKEIMFISNKNPFGLTRVCAAL